MRLTAAALFLASCATTPARKPAAPTPPRDAPVSQPAPVAEPAPAPAPTPPPAVQPPVAPAVDAEKAVNETLDAFVSAVNRLDADAVAALHVDAPDTLAIWPGVGEEIRGIDALRAALRNEFRLWKSVGLTLTDREVRVLSPDAAWVFGHYDQMLEAAPSGRRAVSRKVQGARFFVLMIRRAEGWRMWVEAGSIPLDAEMFDALVFPPPFRQRKPKDAPVRRP